jgi:hypothetical protein
MRGRLAPVNADGDDSPFEREAALQASTQGVRFAADHSTLRHAGTDHGQVRSEDLHGVAPSWRPSLGHGEDHAADPLAEISPRIDRWSACVRATPDGATDVADRCFRSVGAPFGASTHDSALLHLRQSVQRVDHHGGVLGQRVPGPLSTGRDYPQKAPAKSRVIRLCAVSIGGERESRKQGVLAFLHSS